MPPKYLTPLESEEQLERPVVSVDRCAREMSNAPTATVGYMQVRASAARGTSGFA